MDEDRKELWNVSSKAWMNIALNMREVNTQVLSGKPQKVDRFLDDSHLQITLMAFNAALAQHLIDG